MEELPRENLEIKKTLGTLLMMRRLITSAEEINLKQLQDAKILLQDKSLFSFLGLIEEEESLF